MLGVCLGHQSLVEAFGGRTVQGEPIHGKDAEVEHDGRTIFAGLPSPLVAGRYHSLVADPDLPDELELSASLGDVVMGARHRELPAEGVQFHPESVLTPQGKHLLAELPRARADGAMAQRRRHPGDRRGLRRRPPDRRPRRGGARRDHGGARRARSRPAPS